MVAKQAEVILINPCGHQLVYQGLATEISAIEPPLWCRLIAGYLRDRGAPVRIIDADALGWDATRVAAESCLETPALAVVVVYGHHPSASTQMMEDAGQICRELKALRNDLPVMIVGGHVAALPERTMRDELADFACIGEGPVTIHGLWRGLREGEDWTKVPGLVWRDGETVRINPAPPLILDLDRELHGDVWDLLPMHLYRAHNWHCFGEVNARRPYASIYTSLGCPFKCSFCCIHAPFGSNRYRRRSPEAVVAEIDGLREKYGIRHFKIADEMFVLHEGHVMTICDLLIDRGYDLNIWAYARVDTVKPRFLDKMRQAGFHWLALGIESGSKHVRDGADKTMSEDEIRTVVRQIQAAGIHVIGNYIFGLPDDDLVTMRETLDLAQSLNCEFANFYSAMAYPGAPLYDTALREGWRLPERWSGFSQHSEACLPLPTHRVSAVEVLRFRDQAFQEYFSQEPYLERVGRLFGEETRRHIAQMASHRLRRSWLEASP